MPNVKRKTRRDDDEDEEDERPSRSRRSRDDEDEDEEDERPARRRSRSRDDDDDEEEERPRRSSRRSSRDDDDEEEERPRRSRRSRDDEDEEEERPRRSSRRSRDDEEDEEDEKPRGKRSRRDRDDEDEDEVKRGRRSQDSTVRKGWDGYNQNKGEGGEFADELEVTGESQLILFLDDDPLVSYRQHWLDSPPNGIKKKSWVCLGKNADCPLCEIGEGTRTMTIFNVLLLNSGGDYVNKVLKLGVKATGQLKNLADDKKTGPLTRLYWAVSKGGKPSYTYNFRPVKERDLDEDWGLEPLSESDIRKAKKHAYTEEEAVQTHSRRQLRELADGLMDED